MPWSIGDTYERSIASHGMQVIVRWEVTVIAAPSPDDDPIVGPEPTDGDPLDFAILDRRTPEQVAEFDSSYNGNRIELVTQYISADPDDPTWNTITNPMKSFFRFENGLSAGSKRL